MSADDERMQVGAAIEAVTVEIVGASTTLLRLVGEIDVQSTVVASPELMRLKLAPPRHLRIDATEVTFLDSSGITALVTLALEVQKRGGGVSMDASLVARRIVEMCGIDGYLGLTAQ